MIKITIILFILTLITNGICKLVGNSLDNEERAIAIVLNEYPTRFILSIIAFYVSIIAFVICLIITVVTW